jgi:hypothetical protein
MHCGDHSLSDGLISATSQGPVQPVIAPADRPALRAENSRARRQGPASYRRQCARHSCRRSITQRESYTQSHSSLSTGYAPDVAAASGRTLLNQADQAFVAGVPGCHLRRAPLAAYDSAGLAGSAAARPTGGGHATRGVMPGAAAGLIRAGCRRRPPFRPRRRMLFEGGAPAAGQHAAAC